MDCAEEFDFNSSILDFIPAVELYIKRPHLVDKRLSGCVLKSTWESDEAIKVLVDSLPKVKEYKKQEATENYVSDSEPTFLIPREVKKNCFCIHRNLIVKKDGSQIEDILIWQWSEADVAVFYVINKAYSEQNYFFKICENSKLLSFHHGRDSPVNWVKHVLIKKLIKWSSEEIDETNKGKLKFPKILQANLYNY